jgi:hypothetical protein
MKTTLLPLALALLAGAGPAQVILSEINFFPQGAGDDQWIELVNTSSAQVDLTTWSLYQATNTTGQPNNYWFGFPPGTRIAAGGYLRVHWRAAIPTTPPPPTEVYTGNTVYHFLFGYGAEALAPAAGALALFNSQQNIHMKDPSFQQDWVSWGVNGLRRENIAIAGGLWLAGQFVTRPVQTDSLARIYGAQRPFGRANWFHDASPSGLKHNHENAATQTFGAFCSFGAMPPPSLSARSLPAIGNRDFGAIISNTVAAPGNVVALMLGIGRGTGNVLIGPCPVWISETTPILFQVDAEARAGQTQIDLPIPPIGVNGGEVVMQAFVLNFQSFNDAGFSNGLEARISIE